MLKTKTIVVPFCCLLMGGVSPALAGSIQKHQAHEEHRIQKGVRHGGLTPKEASRLQNQENLIKIERAQAMQDGKMTHRERHDIRHDQKRLSKDIHHKRWNAKRTQPPR